MIPWLSKIETSYNLLNKNFKIAVIGFSFFATFFIWYSFMSDLSATMSKNKKNIEQAEVEITSLKKQSDILKTQVTGNKRLQLKKEEDALKKDLSTINNQIASFRYQLVSPKDAFFKLKNMLNISAGVKLLSIQYLPEELVKDTSQSVIRTPIELVIQGGFSDVYAYFKAGGKRKYVYFLGRDGLQGDRLSYCNCQIEDTCRDLRNWKRKC